MTDPLSERLEKELRPAVKNYCGSEDCRPLLKLMIEAVLPILRDEITAAEEALYAELESAVRNHLVRRNPGLKGDAFFALQGAFTLCRRKPNAIARHDAAVRERALEEAAHSIEKHLDYACDREDELVMGALVICRDEIRALKTPQPEMNKS